MTRHAAVLNSGASILQETRHWHEDTGVTTSCRVKSDADDCRYFSEPDLLPVAPTRERVEELRATMPEPPDDRRRRLQNDWDYRDMEMREVMNAGAVKLIEESVAAGATPAGARKWWMGELARRASTEGRDLADFGVTPADVAELDTMVGSGRLNDSMARQVLDAVLAGEGSPLAVADARRLLLVSDDGALSAAVDAVIAANPDVADKVREGKVQAAGALIGQVMTEMKGQADAAKIRELILTKLGAS